ncbi:hypothetical protein HanHA300_Chr07g0228931 [Helianthus annuus]|nr:hypothetical protein HanHA300_Chr07g0228931 [Helianthus annuus]
MWVMFIQVNKFEYLSNQVHVTVQLHFGQLRSTQLWFGSTSQHRSALIRVSLGLSSSAGLSAARFNPVRLGITQLSENGGNFVRYQAKVAAKRMLLNMAPSKGCVWLWVQQWCSLTVYCCTACFYFGYRS